jgi:hypothetical protein
LWKPNIRIHACCIANNPRHVLLLRNEKYGDKNRLGFMPRCVHCKKRTHLVFTCQCPGEFCVKCRTPEVHECKEYVTAKIVLVKVVAEKVTPV